MANDNLILFVDKFEDTTVEPEVNTNGSVTG